MSKTWIRAKHDGFVRDVVRDFCLVSRALEREFKHFDKTGHVDFSGMRNLLGHEMNKGLLWRLKDTAHLLFKQSQKNSDEIIGQFLDWSVGYIFHDAIKLKEDAYQQQNYAPWFKDLKSHDLPAPQQRIATELFGVLDQTNESMQREINRIRFILYNIRRLLAEFLPAHKDNELLARFFVAKNNLVREVFGGGYSRLMTMIYGEYPENMYILASISLRKGGWFDEAAKSITEAERIHPENPDVTIERQRVDAKKI